MGRYAAISHFSVTTKPTSGSVDSLGVLLQIMSRQCSTLRLIADAWFAFLGPAVLTHAEQPQLEKIFNGRDFTGWKVPQNNIWWTHHDGVLTAKSGPDKKGTILWTTEKYEDFIIEFDFRMGPGSINSGIFLRDDKE